MPLDGAGGQYHLFGPHLPQALAGRRRRRCRTEVVGDLLEERQVVVDVVADGRRAGEQPHLFHVAELGHRLGHPLGGRLAVDGVTAAENGAAEFVLLVDEDDPRPAASRRQRCRQTGGAAADDDDVGMGVAFLVTVRIGAGRCCADAAGLADGVLVARPQALRPHEGLVVEAGGQEPREAPGHRPHVEIDARPAVGAGRLEAFVKLLAGGLDVGFRASAAADLQERVNLLGAGAEDAARPVVLETARHHRDAVGHERRGQRVAGTPLEAGPVEGEIDGARTVDAPALGQALALGAHLPSPGGSSPTL